MANYSQIKALLIFYLAKTLIFAISISLAKIFVSLWNGRVAQRESTSLTSRGSLVQSQSCPPYVSKGYANTRSPFYRAYLINV
jgi:hypothetical protein